MLQIRIFFGILLVVLVVFGTNAALVDSLYWMFEEPSDREIIILKPPELTAPSDIKDAYEDYKKGNFRFCIERLEKYRRLQLPDPNLDFVTFILAECYRCLGLKRLAKKEYSFLIQNFGLSDKVVPSLFRLLQYAYEEKNDNLLDSIVGLFQTEYKNHYLYNHALYILAKSQFFKRNYEQTIKTCGLIPQHSQCHFQAQFLSALAHIETNRLDKALILLEYVRKNAKNIDLIAEASIFIGDIYYNYDNFKVARRYYKSIPPESKRFAYAQIKLARSYLDEGELNNAKAIANSFLKNKEITTYFFEMSAIIQEVYTRLGEQKKASKIATTILKHIQNARYSFEIYDELNHLERMIRGWKNLSSSTDQNLNKKLEILAEKEVKKLYSLQKRYLDLIGELSGAPPGEREKETSYMLEHRYLSVTKKAIADLRDSISAYQTLLDTLGQYIRDSAAISALELHKNKTQVILDSLSSLLINISEEYSLVIDEFSQRQETEWYSEEARQVRYLDWAFLEYFNQKKNLLLIMKELSKHKDSQKDTLVEHTKSKKAIHYSNLQVEKMQKDISEYREWLVDFIHRFLELTPYTNYAAGVLFRLAELMHDKSEEEFIKKMKEYEQKTAGKDSNAAAIEFPEYNLSAAIKIYDKIIQNYPYDNYADDAYFYKAKALQKMGLVAEANLVLEQLVSRYPNSEFFVEANMNIGGYYFLNSRASGNRGYLLAEEAYKRVLQYKDHPQFVQALYHLGWCYYMQDQYDKAISVFKYLIEEARLDFDPLNIEQKSLVNPLLRDEAIDYIAISFDEGRRINEAIDFLSLVGNIDYAAMVLKRIGELRLEDLDYQAAADIYERLLQKYPNSIIAPSTMVELVKIYESMKQTEIALQKRALFFRNYSRGTALHKAIFQRDSTLIPKIDSMVVSMGCYVADIYFRNAESTNDINGYIKAAENYKAVFERYPDLHIASDALWNLAALYETKIREPEKAIIEYLRYSRLELADRIKRQKAALNAIALAQHGLLPDSLVRKGELEISAVEVLDACTNYLKLFPDGEDAASVLFTMGSIYFNRGMFSNAAFQYQQILDLSPGSENYYKAMFLLAQCQFEEENWESSAKGFETVWKNSSNQSQKAEAYKLLLQSYFLNAKKLYRAGAFDKAAAAFLEIEKKYPASEYSDAALFNAAEALEKQQQLEKACEVYYTLVKKYGNSKLASEALFNAASNYEKIEKFDKAAETYEILVQNYPQSPKAKDGLFNLGFCYEKLQKLEKMAEINERYARMYPEEKDAEVMVMKSGQYYFKAKMYERAENVFKNFINRFSSTPLVLEAVLMLGKICDEQQRYTDAINYYRQVEEVNRKLVQEDPQISMFFAAEAAYLTAEIKRKQFSNIALVLPLQKLELNRKLKAELLAEAIASYQKVIQYQSEKMFEAAFRIAELYETFANSWAEQELPKLDPIKTAVAEKENYEVASKMLQKAFAPYTKVLEIASNFDSLPQEQKSWVERSRNNLTLCYDNAGQMLIKAIRAMIKAPIPDEIRKKPLHNFQYRKQLLETLLPMKIAARDYYIRAAKEMKTIGLDKQAYQKCFDEAARLTYLIANDYEQLAQEMLNKESFGAGLSEEEKEDLVFQLEDMIFEIQDKALLTYEDAKHFSEDHGLTDTKWYQLVMKGLARLSPETYGKYFFQPFVTSTHQAWPVRVDSIPLWNTANIRMDGWKSAKIVDVIPYKQFPLEKARLIWAENPSAKEVYIWKHIFLDGIPREGSLYIASNPCYSIYLNGTLVCVDTLSKRSTIKIDSITGITPLLKGGDNVIAIHAWSADTQKQGIAVAFKAFVDTSQRFKISISHPNIEYKGDTTDYPAMLFAQPTQSETKETLQVSTTVPKDTVLDKAQKAQIESTKIPKQQVSGVTGKFKEEKETKNKKKQKTYFVQPHPTSKQDTSKQSSVSTPITTSSKSSKEFRNKGELMKALYETQKRKDAAELNIRRERMEYQKLKIREDYIDKKIQKTKEEIEMLKKMLYEKKRLNDSSNLKPTMPVSNPDYS